MKNMLIHCLIFFELLLKAKSQQYICTMFYTENQKNFSTVTVSDRCPSIEECQNSDHSYDLEEKTYFSDKETNNVGMMFSWKPKHINTSAPFCGFKITTRKFPTSFSNSTYFCPNISTLPKQPDFFFECRKFVQPSELYSVTISPLPDNDYEAFLNFTTKIPDCSSSSIAKSPQCKPQSLISEPKISENFGCDTSLFEVKYNLGTEERETVTVRGFECDHPTDGYFSCIDTEELKHRDLPLINRINLTIPKTISASKYYYIDVYTYNKYSQSHGIRREPINVTDLFHSCIEPEKVAPKSFPMHFIAIIAAALLSFAILGVIAYKTKCSAGSITTLVKPTYGNEPVIPKLQTLYIVYVCDHAKHQEVVLKLAAYLKCDLGFQIFLEHFNSEEVFKDPSAWMESSFTRANKVLFIWSPNAAKRWNERDKQTSLTDMFTPVLRKAVTDMWKSNNYKKYYFLNFGYCDANSIPTQFKSRRCKFFNLMDDFGEFSLSLLGLEMSKCVQFCFDETFCELAESRYGQPLLDAVETMNVYTQKHSNWFEEASTVSLQENSCTECSLQVHNVITNLTNELVIIPPSPIQKRNFIADSNNVVENNPSFLPSESNSDAQSQEFCIADLNRTQLQTAFERTSAEQCHSAQLRHGIHVVDQRERHGIPVVDHRVIERSDLTNESLQCLYTRQSSYFSENDFLLQNESPNYQLNSMAKFKPANIVLAPLDIHTDPMTSLNEINNQAQISRL